jgi:hypothetical protein
MARKAIQGFAEIERFRAYDPEALRFAARRPAAQGRIFSLAYPHLRLRVRSPSVGANLSSRLTALHRCSDSVVVDVWAQVGSYDRRRVDPCLVGRSSEWNS